MATAKIQLQLVDVQGRPLDDPDILVEFFSNESSKHFRFNVSPNGAANVNISLVDPGNGMYRVLLMPTNYRTIQFFLRIMEDGTTTRKPVVFPVDPAKVVSITAPAIGALPQPLQDLLGNAIVHGFTDAAGAPLQGAALYNALPALLKAALLNLYTKSATTRLGDGQSVFDKLGTMIRLKQDRLFAKTAAALLEETQQDTFFHALTLMTCAKFWWPIRNANHCTTSSLRHTALPLRPRVPDRSSTASSASSSWPHTAGVGRDRPEALRYRTTGPKTGQRQLI